MQVHFGAFRVNQNQTWTSPQATLPDPTYAIDGTIGSTAWDTTAGTWSWAIDYMRTDGSWGVLVGQGRLADPVAGVDGNIGDRDKSGGFPAVGFSATEAGPDGLPRPVNLGGMVVRFRIWASARINLNKCDLFLDEDPIVN